ncbi:lens intrinsic membrane protein 2.2 isoform X2 [Alosa alosa]|uniref:lens intrinsic membrane protein 2.2 isoform X2 n=1 Tax=Alosa alosa TaxID=278164 RepID=UPI002015448D|nr:lens intrinsic membrane protein 2.2 isoform X2 [Alosa alosa]
MGQIVHGGLCYPRSSLDVVHVGRWGHTLWCGCPGAAHSFHGDRLLDAVPLLGQLGQPGTVEILHQQQVPCSHSHSFWDATRAFMLLSILSCFAGVVLGLSAFANGAKSRRVRTGGIALLLSGFLALLALAIYTGVTVNFFGKRYIDWRFSWSYILGWLGIILSFTAGGFQLCAYQRNTAEPPPPDVSDS